jgi:site-specific recombinase XerD
MNGASGAPKTIARKLSAISSYFDFLAEKNLILFNPVSSVKRPRKEVKTPTNALNAQQVRELLAAIDENSASGKLHKALLMTFFFTGLRKNEILLLKIKNYKDMGDYKILEFAGKGGKLGQKVLHPKAAEAITEYLALLKEKTGEQHFEDWLFRPTKNPADPTNTNKPLNPKTINEILDNYALKIGLPFKVSPHSARATFISELLEQGVDIYKVALEVNHSSVKTTQEYDKRRQKLQDHLTLKLNY